MITFARVTIDLEYSRENMIKILKRGIELQFNYLHMGDCVKEITATEAADLSKASIDPDWAGAMLSVKCPDLGYFDVSFFPKNNGALVSFSGFERNPFERSFKYKLPGIDFAPYINFLLNFIEPYPVVAIEVGYEF